MEPWSWFHLGGDRLAGSLAFELDCALREVADAQRSGDFESMIEVVAVVATINKIRLLIEHSRESWLVHAARRARESR